MAKSFLYLPRLLLLPPPLGANSLCILRRAEPSSSYPQRAATAPSLQEEAIRRLLRIKELYGGRRGWGFPEGRCQQHHLGNSPSTRGGGTLCPKEMKGRSGGSVYYFHYLEDMLLWVGGNVSRPHDTMRV